MSDLIHSQDCTIALAPEWFVFVYFCFASRKISSIPACICASLKKIVFFLLGTFANWFRACLNSV